MKKITEGNLKSAFSGESQAHMRYMIFSERAGQDGYLNAARLFKAISYAERVHATNHFKQLSRAKGAGLTVAMAGFGLAGSSQNLETAIEGETFEVEEMYPVYMSTAEQQGEGGPRESFDWAYQAEKIHAAIFKRAKQAVDEGRDVDLGPLQICTVCGHTVEGEAPDRCPVCNATRDRYMKF